MDVVWFFQVYVGLFFTHARSISRSGVASPTIYSHANFKLSLLFISLEIDCFQSQWTPMICMAGPNRWAGYATD